MSKLVLLRHGESEWNKKNLFTGWKEPPLSEKGRDEARHAGALLKEAGFSFDIALTSVHVRAHETLNLTLRELGQVDIPVRYSWRLNERHYGALQGLDKHMVFEKYGQEQFMIWRRSYNIPPPPMTEEGWQELRADSKYRDVEDANLPRTECVRDVIARVAPYWETEIMPRILAGEKVLVCAHGNSLRALAEILESLSPEEVVELTIPTGMPLVYEFGNVMEVEKHYYLGDPAEVEKRIGVVKDQGLH